MKNHNLLSLRNRLRERKKAHLDALSREMKRIAIEAEKIGVHRIILFGSMARDKAALASDLDLLIVMDSDLDFIERTAQIYRCFKPEVGMDIMVYTPEEFDRMRTNPFIRNIIAEGRVLYEA